MKSTIIFLSLILFLSSYTCSSQLLSPTSYIDGTILPSTQSVFIGTTEVKGDFHGYPLDMIPENPFINNISVFPLLGSSVLRNIDRVTLIDVESLDVEGYQDYSDLPNITQFSDVNIRLYDGLFLLGTDNGRLSVDATFEYCIATTYSLTLEDISSRFLILLSSSQSTARHQGEQSVLMQYNRDGTIQVTNPIGEQLWTSSTGDTLLLIEDEQYLVTQQSSMYLYPLMNSSGPVSLSITQAPREAVDIESLLNEVTSVANMFGDIPDITSMVQGFESVVSAAESILNGGMLLIETEDSMVVDDTLQQFSTIGFARGSPLNVKISSASGVSTVDGSVNLLFLGDHFYSTQAKNSDNGFQIPLLAIVLWIGGIAAFIFVKFYLKKQNDEEKDQKLKYYALVIHIVCILVVFFLVDREISFKFGYSMFDSIMDQGLSLILLFFLSLQLSIWSLGYLFFAFPLKLSVDSIFLYFGYGRKAKHLSKGIALFSIWFFAAFYVTLVFNLIFLFINPTNFLPL